MLKSWSITLIIEIDKRFIDFFVLYTFVHVHIWIYIHVCMFGLFVQYHKSDFFVLSVWRCYVTCNWLFCFYHGFEIKDFYLLLFLLNYSYFQRTSAKGGNLCSWWGGGILNDLNIHKHLNNIFLTFIPKKIILS